MENWPHIPLILLVGILDSKSDRLWCDGRWLIGITKKKKKSIHWALKLDAGSPNVLEIWRASSESKSGFPELL